MSFFDRISEPFSAFDWHHDISSTEPTQINPATGLPMTGPGIGGVDVGGNPYGTSLHRPRGKHVWNAYDDHAHHLTHDYWNNWSNLPGSYDPSRD